MLATIVMLGALAAAASAAQTPTTPAPPPKLDCTAPEFRGFDFWLGAWTVTQGGKPAGSSRIEADMKGCAVIEHWTSANGGRGTSLNFYDRRLKRWSQAWIDEGGNALHLFGGVRDGAMVLTSEPRETPAGRDVQRITWSKVAGGSVRQLWESSTDGGKTWTVSFDGLYTPR
jgi:hypothetical protein